MPVARPFLLTIAIAAALPAGAQEAPVPSARADAFRDAGARALVTRALDLRDAAAAGLASYEATATERTHIGMAVTRRLPLRSRTLYHREQIARVYWRREGSSVVRWIGRRTSEPMHGVEGNATAFGLDLDLARELDLDDIGIDLLFDPFGDRMDVFQAEFIQPVSAEGLRTYVFESGDTTFIRLPAPSRSITLVEVVVHPRAKAWEAVEGSLWFDLETGVLARAAFRPSAVWDYEVREPHDLDDVPGFLKPAIGTVRSIVVEYALFDQRWWLPRRVSGEAVYDWGHGLVRMPITIEWTMSGHIVNEAPGADVSPGDGLVRVGTSSRGDDRRRYRTDHYAQPGVDLSRASELPPPLVEGEVVAFTPDELRALVRRLDEVAGPLPAPPSPGPGRAVLTSLRYDRVRGLSAAYERDFIAGRFTIRPWIRLAVAIPDLFANVEVARGPLSVDAYHRLDDASDWNVAGGLGNSVATILFGNDGGDYYRADGASIAWTSGGVPLSGRIEAFAEREQPIATKTTLSFATLGGGSLRPNLEADRIDLAGMRATIRGQHGSDPRKTVLAWRVSGEAAAGGADHGRVRGGVRISRLFAARTAAAFELGAGMAHQAPPQREFLLGGVATLRGIDENAVRGPAFWLARGELGTGPPWLRGLLFTDVGWAGDADAFAHGRPVAGAGIGLSLMDGLLRADLAHGVLRANTWRAYFYLDALL